MTSAKKSTDLLKVIVEYVKNTKGFDSTMKKVEIVSGGNGRCLAEFKVEPEHLNRGGGLHGGFTATLVDTISTYALMATETHPPGVSVDLHVSYLKAAKEGDELLVDANTVKAGKTLAFLDVEIRKKNGGGIIARGTHTKFIGS